MTFNTLLFIDPFEKVLKAMGEYWVAHKMEQEVERKGRTMEVNSEVTVMFMPQEKLE